MQAKKYLIVAFLFLFFSLSACKGPTSEAPKPSQVGMANPASVHCQEKGGKLEIRTDTTGGEYGVCIFPDGSECEEWAFFRGECQPGQSQAAPSPQPIPTYSNEEYGFTIDSPSTWAIEEHADEHYIIFRQGEYFLFIGYKWADEELPPFRTGMPAGDFADGGSATLLGQPIPKRLLVFEGKTKVVEYGANLEAGNLRLFIWLDADGADYAALDIPAEIIAQADQIVASIALTSR